MGKMVYVALVGEQIAVSEYKDTSVASVHEMVANRIDQAHSDIEIGGGEVRANIKIRLAYVELRS